MITFISLVLGVLLTRFLFKTERESILCFRGGRIICVCVRACTGGVVGGVK